MRGALNPCKFVLSALVLVATIAAPPVGAEIYKWVDNEGRVHFGDKAGSNAAQTVDVQPAKRAGSGTASTVSEEERRARTERLLNEYAAERADRAETKQKAANELAERRERCKRARDRKIELENSGYLYERDAAGNKVILPDSELRAEKMEVEKAILAVCKGISVPVR